MSDVPVWHLFAYMNGDAEGRDDETRRVADWQLHDVIHWCEARGYDHIYLYRDETEKTRFQRAEPSPVRHHKMRLVEGSTSEPGDEAA